MTLIRADIRFAPAVLPPDRLERRVYVAFRNCKAQLSVLVCGRWLAKKRYETGLASPVPGWLS